LLSIVFIMGLKVRRRLRRKRLHWYYVNFTLIWNNGRRIGFRLCRSSHAAFLKDVFAEWLITTGRPPSSGEHKQPWLGTFGCLVLIASGVASGCGPSTWA
jgi:hypothetical protein